MYTQPHDVEKKVISTYRDIAKKYPITAGYSSKATLFNDALRNGDITQEDYDMAKHYYGNLWNYTGD